MEYSPGKSRQWNADRRARPQRRVGASRPLRGAPRTRWCGHETLRLSAFRFLRFSFFFRFRHCLSDWRPEPMHAAGFAEM